MELVWLIPGTLLILFLGRAAVAFLDHRRIRQHVEVLGGKVLDITWAPFRSSWSYKNRQDVYSVTIEDATGATRTLYCKTSPLEGVFLADDRDEPLAMDLQTPGRRLADKRRRLQRPEQVSETESRPPSSSE